MTRYQYTVSGLAADSQTWTITGEVSTIREGDFPNATIDALANAFQQLTQGKAIYGQPGVGCHGPYTIARLEVVRLMEES
jgi:hypothetical protein